MADFLVALADFDRKRLWVELGYSSLFYFLHRELGLSAGAAQYRKTAAEFIPRFPEVVEPLRVGRLCITSIVELARVMTPENRAEVLPRFFHASKQQAKAVAAEIAPRESAPHRAVVTAFAPALAPRQSFHPVETPRTLARVSAPALALSQSLRPGETPQAQASASAPQREVPAPEPAPRTTSEPLTAELRRLHVTVSKRFLEKLEVARDALSHSHPGADAEAILEAGLDLLIERHAKRKGIVAKPRKASSPLARIAGEGKGEGGCVRTTPPSAKESRHIPAHVQREVWIRDGGRCQWPVADGEVCGSTRRIQFDHIVPRARGGASTAANLRLTCQFHNLLAARQAFGDDWMDRFAPGGRRAISPHAALADADENSG